MRLMAATSARSTGLDIRSYRLSRKLNFSHSRYYHDPSVFYVAENSSSSTAVALYSYRGPCHKFCIINIPTPCGFVFLYRLLFAKVFQSSEQSIPVYSTLICQVRRGYNGASKVYDGYSIAILWHAPPYQHSIRSSRSIANGISLSVSQTLPNIRRQSAEILVDKNGVIRHASNTSSCPNYFIQCHNAVSFEACVTVTLSVETNIHVVNINYQYMEVIQVLSLGARC